MVRGTMACDFGLKGLGYGSRLPRCGAVSLGKTLHLYVHSLDPGVNGYLVGQYCLCVWIATSAVMAAVLYAPQGVELALEWTGPIIRENWCEVHRNVIMLRYISTWGRVAQVVACGTCDWEGRWFESRRHRYLAAAATLRSWTRHFTHACPSPTRSAKRGEYGTPPGRQSYPGGVPP